MKAFAQQTCIFDLNRRQIEKWYGILPTQPGGNLNSEYCLLQNDITI